MKTKYLTKYLNKTDYNTKVTEIENKLTNHNHDKYIDTQEFNKLAADVFNARLAQANLITKTDFDAKLSRINRKITKNKTENVLVKNQLSKLKAFDSSYFIDKSHFEEDGTQNYLAFQPIVRYFKIIPNTNYVPSWKSIGLSAETIKSHTTSPLTASHYNLELFWYKSKIKIYKKLFKTRPNFIYSWKSRKRLYCL